MAKRDLMKELFGPSQLKSILGTPKDVFGPLGVFPQKSKKNMPIEELEEAPLDILDEEVE